MRDAKVVTGSRGPEAREKVRAEARSKEAADKSALAQVAALIARDKPSDKRKPLKDSPNRVTYQSRAGSYRLSLEAPVDTFDPGTGRRTVHRGVTWQFNNSVFVSDDPREQAIAEAKRGYSLSGDFWRAADASKRDVQKAVAELVRTVKGAPESIRAEVLSALSADGDEFKLPEVAVAEEGEEPESDGKQGDE